MRVRTFKKRYWVSIICLILFYYAFFHGPLFPWNPVKPGYEVLSKQTYTVYYPQDTELPAYYNDLDTYLEQTSSALDLPLNRNIKLVRTDKARLHGYLPWLNTDNLGGAALLTGGVLYISYEKIAEQGLSEEAYIKHEVVHLMHHQNTNIFNAAKIGNVTYLTEGVPFYEAGPRYYTREDFINRVKKAKLVETTEGDEIYTPETFDAWDEESAEQYKVSHMVYGEFIGYLIKNYGQEKFNTFNKEFLNTPSLHRTLFEEIYGKKLEVALSEFEDALLK